MESGEVAPKSFFHSRLTHTFRPSGLFLSARRVKCLLLDRWFSSRVILPPRGDLAMCRFNGDDDI